MKELFALYRNLPPEVRILLLMAGLGGPMGAIFLLRRFMFPSTPMIYIIFGVAAAVGLICLLSWLIAMASSRGKR